MVTSDLLTECPDSAVKEGMGSAEAPRVLSDRWKGMSSEQLSAIYRQRAEQCAEKEVCEDLSVSAYSILVDHFSFSWLSKLCLCFLQRQIQQEKQSNLAFGLQQLEQARQQVEEERRVREMGRERRAQLDQYNQQLAREQQAQ